ncbi:MAG: chemotaxis protein CheB [Vicinamibacterales bacterium]
MTARRLIVIGASSGGLEALRSIVARLPGDLPAAICAVIHTSPDSPGTLASALQRTAGPSVMVAGHGTPLREGHLYLPPPDRHVLVTPGQLQLSRGPRENRFRPAIDPLFRTAAQVYGPASIGVILTGDLHDGTAGLWTIKRLGGLTVAQDPREALFPSMPDSAIRHVEVDHTARLSEIPELLVRLVMRHPTM